MSEDQEHLGPYLANDAVVDQGNKIWCKNDLEAVRGIGLDVSSTNVSAEAMSTYQDKTGYESLQTAILPCYKPRNISGSLS